MLSSDVLVRLRDRIWLGDTHLRDNSVSDSAAHLEKLPRPGNLWVIWPTFSPVSG